jgi:hypothetical protein
MTKRPRGGLAEPTGRRVDGRAWLKRDGNHGSTEDETVDSSGLLADIQQDVRGIRDLLEDNPFGAGSERAGRDARHGLRERAHLTPEWQ